MKRVLIFGGSNSIIKDGWSSSFREKMNGKYEVKNLSVGGCTTVVGLFRLISEEIFFEDDVIIWEYGVNEFNHYYYPPVRHKISTILYYVEHFVNYCIRKKLKLVPVIMSNRGQENMKSDDNYKSSLKDLFSSYGLSALDVNMELRRCFGVLSLPDSAYRDGAHIMPGTDYVNRIADMVCYAVDIAEVPGKVASDPLYAISGKSVAIVDQFSVPETGRFKNSIIDVGFYSLDVPMRCDAPGRLLAAIILTAYEAGGLELAIEGNVVARISTQPMSEPGAPRVMMKQLCIEELLGERLDCEGKSIELRRPSEFADFLIDQTYAPHPVDAGPMARDSIVALLFEVNDKGTWGRGDWHEPA
jgi:hypothetical protein